MQKTLLREKCTLRVHVVFLVGHFREMIFEVDTFLIVAYDTFSYR